MDYQTQASRSLTPSSSSVQDPPVCILEHLKCIICKDLLKEPVTANCGHTFCNECLTGHMKYSVQPYPVCPSCKEDLRLNLHVNVTLRDILKEFSEAQEPSQDMFNGQQGEVPCDVCPDSHKCKAVKSCLMCLLSYCSKHLNRHHNKLWFKGHKLVPPVSELDQRACLYHGRPLELYSVSEEKLICSLCVERGTNVVSVKEERDQRQAELDTVISEMKKGIQQREEKVKEINISAKNCLDLIDQETMEIKNVFNNIKEAIQKAEDEVLSPLIDRRREVEQEAEGLKTKTKKKITSLTNTIKDLEELQDKEDPVYFIQTYPPVPTINDCDNNVFLNTDLSFGTMRSIEVTMMANIKDEFEKLSRIEIARIQKFGVDVTLDRDTANTQLLISDDLKEVRSSVETMDASDSSERFDMFSSVLGQNWLIEDRAFWVVDVGNKQGWDIGVAKEEANRKGSLSVKPSQGYWTIVHYNGDNYAALEDPPTVLTLENKPHKVGVFVDYRETLLSFYDMESETHIYSFTDCAFGSVIRPYFNPHLKQEDPLVILPCQSQ